MQEFSDLTIIAEEKPIYVHRVVLRLQSVYFRTMLQEHWSSEDQRYCLLSGIIVRNFILNMYSWKKILFVPKANVF